MDELTSSRYKQKVQLKIKTFANFLINKSIEDSESYGFNFLEYENDNDIYFNHCQFEIPLEVFNREFKGNIHFRGCTFKLPVQFVSVKFHNSFHFSDCKCKYDILLSDCHFSKTFHICRNEIDSSIIIIAGQNSTNEVKGKTLFWDNSFKKVKIANTNFNEADFSNLAFNESSWEINNCNFKEYTSFRNCNFTNKTKFFNSNLTNCSFLFSNINDALFENCDYDFKELIDEKKLLKDLKAKTLNIIDFKRERKSILETYRKFERIYDNQKNYEYSGNFHKKRFILQRKTEKNWFNKFVNYLYLWFSNYGESYWRSFIWIISSIFVIFPMIYLFTGLNYVRTEEFKKQSYVYKEPIQYWNPLSNNLHFEFKNDYGLALGYSINSSVAFSKDVFVKEVESLNNWTLGWSIFQRLLIPILVTLFIIALRRKYKR